MTLTDKFKISTTSIYIQDEVLNIWKDEPIRAVNI